MLKPTTPWSEEELIKSHDLLIFIAKALHPDLKSLRGISCIAKRRMPVSPKIPGLATVTSPLSNSHKKELLEIFPEISLLRGDMSSGEINYFYKKYRLLKNRPPWTPVFNVATKKKLEKNRLDQYDLMGKHGQLLQEAMDTGEILGLNHDHIPQKHLGLGVLISHTHAVKYLEKYSIPHTLRSDLDSSKEKVKIDQEFIEQEIKNNNQEILHQENTEKIPKNPEATTVEENKKPQNKARIKLRKHILDPIIVDARAQCNLPNSTASILSIITKKAENKEDGLSLNAKGEIQYKGNGKIEYRILDYNKLDYRLKNL